MVTTQALSESVGITPAGGSLYVLDGVGQGLIGRLREQQGEGGAQQRAEAAQHHGSMRIESPKQVHHGSQDSSGPSTHGADADPILSVRDTQSDNHDTDSDESLLLQIHL